MPIKLAASKRGKIKKRKKKNKKKKRLMRRFMSDLPTQKCEKN